MRSVRDKLGRPLEIPVEPQRVISLCPSQTETLLCLGLGERLVGRTRYCIHPADQVSKIPVVGGTKKIDAALVAELQPDLIIAEKEENTQSDVEKLSEIAPVYVTNIESYRDALESIIELGDIVGCLTTAYQWKEKIAQAFARLSPIPTPKSVLYLIWRKPYMAAGKSTFIDSILSYLGLQNIAHSLEGRYPTLDKPENLFPEFVFLSTEPYPFTEKHIPELQAIWPEAAYFIVRGDYFSWYGVRMVEAASYFQRLLRDLSGADSGMAAGRASWTEPR